MPAPQEFYHCSGASDIKNLFICKIYAVAKHPTTCTLKTTGLTQNISQILIPP